MIRPENFWKIVTAKPKPVIISAHMDNLLKLNPCTSDKPQQLRYLYDQMQVQIRGLESLGVTTDSYGQLLIPIIMSKLPNEIRLQISRNTNKEKWEIQELSELIRNSKEIEARETTEHIKATTERVKPFSNFSSSGKSGNPATTSTLFTRPQENISKGSTAMQCVFCGKLHFSASYEKVKDIEEREKILLRDRRCFLCIKVGHRGKDCRSQRQRRKCGAAHHQSICLKEQVTRNSNNLNQSFPSSATYQNCIRNLRPLVT